MGKVDEKKIIQIIPVSFPTWAKYKDENAPSGVCYSPIVCLALAEWQDGDHTYRGVFPMDIADDGIVDFVEDFGNYLGVTLDPAEPASAEVDLAKEHVNSYKTS